MSYLMISKQSFAFVYVAEISNGIFKEILVDDMWCDMTFENG